MSSFDPLGAPAEYQHPTRRRLGRAVPRWACVLLLPALGCARGAQVKELDASREGISLVDGGTVDARMPRPPSASTDAAITRPDSAGTRSPEVTLSDASSEGPSCSATQLCTTPSMGGTVSGDTGADTVSVMGSTSTFVRVNISEDDHTPLIPKRMRVAATLNSPGADFDLFMLADGCTAMLEASEGGFTESVDLTWDDTQGQESARSLILEVRHKAGACDPMRPWVLTVRGN